MKRGIILALSGLLFFAAVVSYKCWKYPRYDSTHTSCFSGEISELSWKYDYFRSAPKYYILLETGDESSFYIHPVLLGKTDQITLEQSLTKEIVVQYDPSVNKTAYGAFRVLSIYGGSEEILSLKDTNRAFKEQRWIGIFTGTVVMVPIEIIAVWLIEDAKRRKE